MKINTLITETMKIEDENIIEEVQLKSPEWLAQKDKCLVAILKKMNDAKK